MIKSLALCLMLLFLITAGHAQNTQSDLEVSRENVSELASLLNKPPDIRPDTGEVNRYCKIARIYWTKRTTDNHAIDSALMFALKAKTISSTLHFAKGHNESAFLVCKVLLEKKDLARATKLLDEVYGEEKVRLLLSIAESYVFHLPAVDKELTQALPLIDKATEISSQIHSLRWYCESLNLMAKLRFNQGDIAGGKNSYRQVIDTYAKLKDYNNEAKYWSRLGTYLPENNNTFPDIIHSQEMAVRLYLLAGNKKEAGYALRDLAVIHTNHDQTAAAGKDFTEMLRLFHEIHEPLSTTTWYLLAE